MLLEFLQAKDKLDQLRERGLHLLKLLGEEFPKNPSSRMAETALQKMKKRLDAMTDDEILSLPLMTDPTKIAATRVIYSLWVGKCSEHAPYVRPPCKLPLLTKMG